MLSRITLRDLSTSALLRSINLYNLWTSSHQEGKNIRRTQAPASGHLATWHMTDSAGKAGREVLKGLETSNTAKRALAQHEEKPSLCTRNTQKSSHKCKGQGRVAKKICTYSFTHSSRHLLLQRFWFRYHTEAEQEGFLIWSCSSSFLPAAVEAAPSPHLCTRSCYCFFSRRPSFTSATFPVLASGSFVWAPASVHFPSLFSIFPFGTPVIVASWKATAQPWPGLDFSTLVVAPSCGASLQLEIVSRRAQHELLPVLSLARATCSSSQTDDGTSVRLASMPSSQNLVLS